MMNPRAHALGRHLLADFYGVCDDLLSNADALATAMVAAAQAAGAVPVEKKFHLFGGGGVTGVVLLRESHISIHTWPEFGFAAVDVFMCGIARPRDAIVALERAWQPARTVIRESGRGELLDVETYAHGEKA